MTTQAIPRTEADLDDRFVSEVLGTPTRVTAREGVGVGSAFACRLFRLTLDRAPGSVIVKLPVEGEVRAMLDAIDVYGREVAFYRDVAPELPVRTPRIYAALEATGTTDFALVMEDLVDCTPAT